jgi:O-antigen/teichoic acid export membrane protein
VYSLITSASSLTLIFLFQWIMHSAMRFIPQATEELTHVFHNNFVFIFLAVSCGMLLCLLIAYLANQFMGNIVGWTPWMWVIFPALVLTEAAFTLVTNYSRLARNHTFRFAISTATRSVLAVIIGYGLVRMGYGIYGILAGTAMSFVLPAVVMAIADAPMRTISRKAINKAVMREILAYGLPVIAVASIQTALGACGKFLLNWFMGAEATGQFSAPLDIVTKLLIFMMMIVHKSAYPLVIRKIETEGSEAARKQFCINATLMMMVSLPMAMGMVMFSKHLAYLFLGEAFHETSARLIPFFVAIALVNCAIQYYISLAFHVAKQTRLLIAPIATAMMVNIVVSCIAIPRYGIDGAVIGAFLAYVSYATMALIRSRKVFALPFPLKDFMKILCAVGVMSLAVLPFMATPTLVNLLAASVVGGAVFVIFVLVLDIAEIRQFVMKRLRKRKQKQ